MIPDLGKLWCGCGNTIKVFNTETLVIENSLTVNNDANKPITSIVLSGNAVWLSLQNSAIVKCFHTISFELLCEVNVAPAVTKMLTSEYYFYYVNNLGILVARNEFQSYLLVFLFISSQFKKTKHLIYL